LIYGHDLPFTATNEDVRVFRHALALDERRARFQPRLFRSVPTKAASTNNAATSLRSSEFSETTSPHGHSGSRFGLVVQRLSSHEHHEIPGVNGGTPNTSREPSTTLSMLSENAEPIPRVLEVWFAGCHSDVGGGAVEDTVRYSLGDISLRWMVKQVILSKCGIKLDQAALVRADIDVSAIALAGHAQLSEEQLLKGTSEVEVVSIPLVRSASSEEGSSTETRIWTHEQDALADKHDELDFNWSWAWFGYQILEYILPATFIWQDENMEDRSERKWNWGKGRVIRSSIEPIYFHESVWQRQQVSDLGYEYAATFPGRVPVYVN